MDEETNDTVPVPVIDREFWIAQARKTAHLLNCGTVRLIDGDDVRTFANSWVPPGEEMVIDLRL